MRKDYFKMLLVFLLLSCSTTVFSQSISVDRMEDDGRHQIMADGKKFELGGTDYNICLKVYESTYPKEQDWLLLISSLSYISKYSARVLLKFDDGSIIDLPVNNVHVGKITIPGYGLNIGSMTTYSPSSEANYYSSVYCLYKRDLEKIENHKIVKIRFFDGEYYKDATFRTNTLGKLLRKSYRNIQERLENPVTPRNIYDGF